MEDINLLADASRGNPPLSGMGALRRSGPLRPGQDLEAEQRRLLTRNWIESYTRQHRHASQTVAIQPTNAENYHQQKSSQSKEQQRQERRRRRSKSAEKYDEAYHGRNDKCPIGNQSGLTGKSKSETSTPDKSPNRKLYRSKMMKHRLKYGSPLKSASLTELDMSPKAMWSQTQHEVERRGSSSSLMSHWLTRNLPQHLQQLDQYGPSSLSSTGTVVQMLKGQNYGPQKALLEEIASGSSSLPPELQYILIQATNNYAKSKNSNISNVAKDGSEDPRGSKETSKTSQTSLSSSKQSESRSYETVIDVASTAIQLNETKQKARKTWSKGSQQHLGGSRNFVLPKRAINSDSMDTEEEIQLVKSSAYNVRKDAEGKDSGSSSGPSNPAPNPYAFSDRDNHRNPNHRAQSLPNEGVTHDKDRKSGSARTISTQTGHRKSPYHHHREQYNMYMQSRKQIQSRKSRGTNVSMPQADLPLFQPSSAATTSEDEKLMKITTNGGNEASLARREHMVEGAGGGRVRRTSYPANSSTLESGAPIDRAKSFEYFPGESFPLQENSSSYEYLPGHMVSDRPGTVVSNHPQENLDANNCQDQLDGTTINNRNNIETSPSQKTNGDYSTTSSLQSSSNGDIDLVKRRNHTKIGPPSYPTKEQAKKRRQYSTAYEMATETHSLAIDLNSISNEMMHKYKHLHNAHLSKTRDFYKKLKRYIEFISTPSNTPSDCSLKQKIAEKLLHVMTDEEMKLSNVRSLSTQFGNLFVTDRAETQLSSHLNTSASVSPVPITTQGTQAPSTSIETDENEVMQPQSIESPTRQIGDEPSPLTKSGNFQHLEREIEQFKSTDNRKLKQNEKYSDDVRQPTNISSPHYFPALQNWIGPSKIDNSYPSSNDVEIQRLRIEQMKKLRKEIRKLEKLECVRLNKALGGKAEDNAELLRQVRESQSSADSLATEELVKNNDVHSDLLPLGPSPQLQSALGKWYIWQTN